jgi:diguanylate cyclase (GGDEF)-like protein
MFQAFRFPFRWFTVRLPRRCLQVWLAAWLGLAPLIAAAAPPLVLNAGLESIPAWSVVTVLSDPSHELTVNDVKSRFAEFKAPTGPVANLGIRRDAVWIRVPVAVPWFESTRWILDIDYPALNNVDMYLLAHDGSVLRHEALGNAIPFSQHSMPSRTLAVDLELASGKQFDVLLRVQTESSTVVPIGFATPAAFYARGVHQQMIQGLIAGVSLFLLLFSSVYWLSLRDRMFVYYAVVNVSVAMFFFALFGLAPQYLWPDNPWLAMHMAPLAILMALIGGALFIDRVLRVGEWSRIASWLLKAIALFALAIGVAGVTGLIGYRALQGMTTMLGLPPMLVAVAAAWVRLRQGDRVAIYILLGWAAYAIGAAALTALLRGWVDANFWTQHAFQFTTLIEMVMWMRVLGVRMEEVRDSAHRAQLERNALRSLAHTDALTGLPNRRGLHQTLANALPLATGDNMVAVYLLDLDGFKPINDRFGHEAGDEVLVSVSRRLQVLLRSSDVVARLGGDEFVVVASGLRSDLEAQQLGHKLLEGFQRPFSAAGRACQVGLTIGYALAPIDGRDADHLLRRADGAMYAGKNAGRHQLQRTPHAPIDAAA